MCVFPQRRAFSGSQENLFYDILEQRNPFLGYKNKKFKMSKNWHFSKGVNPWFCSKNGHYSNFYFLGNTGRENVFYDILEQKNALLDYKNKKAIRLENVFYDILERKNALLDYKKNKFKKSKNWHFFKRVTHGFGPKMADFPTFVFRQYRPGKSLLRYSKTKKRLSRL